MNGRLAALAALVLMLLAVPAAAQANEPPTCSATAFQATAGEQYGGVASCSDPEGSSLTYEVVQNGALGQAAFGDFGSFTYTGSPSGDNHLDRFTFRAKDDQNLASETVVAEIGIGTVSRPACTPPLAIALRYEQYRTSSAYCFDSGASVISYVPIATPTNGELDLGGFADDGFWSFTAGSTEATDDFTYKATNSAGDSLPVSQLFVVDPDTNAKPLCSDGFTSIRPGATRALSLSCYDQNSDPLTYSIPTPPAHGTLGPITTQFGAGSVNYTAPATDTEISDEFDFTANDNFAGPATSTATMHITIDPDIVNEAPDCGDTTQNEETQRDQYLDFFVSCFDQEVIQYAKGTTSHGTLSDLQTSEFGGSYFRFTPETGYTGPASFEFTASDGQLQTLVHVDVDVQAPPTPQCTNGDPQPLRSGTFRNGFLSCTFAVSFALVPNSQTNLTVSDFSSDGDYTVHTVAGFTGTASFQYMATNENGTSGPFTKSFAVSPTVNAAPDCGAGFINVRVGSTRTVDFGCTDSDGDPVTLTVASGPSLGSVDGIVQPAPPESYGSIVYHAPAPSPELVLPADTEFHLTAADDHGGSSDVEVSVTVQPENYNATPSCSVSPPFSGVYSGGDANFFVFCSDPDGDPLTYALDPEGAPAAGNTVTGPHTFGEDSPPYFTYHAASGFTGADAFDVVVDDGRSQTSLHAGFTVQAPPTPTCPKQPAKPVRIGTTKSWGLTCSVGGSPFFDLSYEVVDLPAHGTLQHFDGTVVYTPDADDGNGNTTFADSFTYRASLNGNASALQTYDIQVSPTANEAPICDNSSFRVREGATKRFGMSCYDPDGDAITITPQDPPHGSLSDLDPSNEDFGSLLMATYTPDAGFEGIDEFTFSGNDGHGGVDTATIEVEVTDVSANALPSCDVFNTAPGPRANSQWTFSFECSDADGDPMSLAVSNVTHGTMGDVTEEFDSSGNAFYNVTFTPATDYVGAASFDYTPSDSLAAGVKQTVDFTVRAANANLPPQCSETPPARTVEAGGQVYLGDMVDYCHDADRDTLTVVELTGPSHGDIVTIEGDKFYVADGDFVGDDTITWRLSDGHGATSQLLTQTIHVTAAAPTPNTAITAHPAPTTQLTTASFSFNSPNRINATFECRLDPANPSDLSSGWSACGSGKTYDGLAAGTHLFQVRALDNGQTDPTPASFEWTIDTTAPGAPTITPASKPADFVNVQTVAFAFTGEGAEFFECRYDQTGEFVPCTSGTTKSGLGEGAHTFEVRAVDAAGNRSAVATDTWTIDLTDPTTTIATKPADPSNSQTAAFTFSSEEANVTYRCNLDNGGEADCPASYTGLGQGSHTLSVVAVDRAGNRDETPATYTWVVDTVAPANLAFAQKPAATTTEHTAHFEFSADGATAFQCKLDTGAFASCTSPKDLDTLGEGSHTFTVRALDAAGNSVELAHTWTVEAPVVENVVPASGGTVGTAAADAVPTPGDPVIVRVTVPAGDTGGAVSIQEQASATGDAPSGFSFFGEQLVIEAPARTAANPLRISLLIDAATLAAAGVTKDTIEITRDNVVVEECTTADGTATPDPCVSERKALADGDVEIVVLTSHASKWNFAKDSKKPDTTITGGPTGETTATDASFGLTSDEAATFECKLDGGAYAPCDATKSFSGLAVGDHTFSARAKDATGNVDDSPATRTWKVAAPPVTTTDPTPTTTTTPTTPTTPPTTPVTPKDTTAPIVSLKAAKQKIKAVLAKGLALTAGCDEICAMKITVTIDAKTAKRLKLGKKAVTAGSATASKSGKVTVKLSRKVAAKLKKAKSVLLTVKVAAVDAAGNPQTKTLKVTLKR